MHSVLALTILGLALFSRQASAKELVQRQFEAVGYSQEWVKLLHLPAIGRRSLISARGFFLADGNGRDPEAELKASIEHARSDPDFACRFPARAEVLRRRLGLVIRPCPAVEAWKAGVRGDTLSLVFVSQYVSNPASFFGHSFLLFGDRKKALNMHVALTHAAQIPEDVGGLIYAFEGLTGGFPGEYSAEPNYIKIQEYSGIENRDMWTYELEMSPEQIEQLLNHVWELAKMAPEPYYFLNRNCSVRIYNALAAVHPNLEFLPRYSPYVLPIETMKRVVAVTRRVSYRPSQRALLDRRFRDAGDEVRAEFSELTGVKSTPEQSRNVETLELALEYFEFKKSVQAGNLDQKQRNLFESVLRERARAGSRPPRPDEPTSDGPHKSHGTWRFAAGGERQAGESIGIYRFSPFHHSLLQKSVGFLPDSEVIFLDGRFSSRSSSDWKLNEIVFLSVANFVPHATFDSRWSWRTRLGLVRFIECESCMNPNGEALMGKSTRPYPGVVFYALGGVGANDTSEPDVRARAGGILRRPGVAAKAEFVFDRPIRPGKENRDALELGLNISLSDQLDIETSLDLEAKRSDARIWVNMSF